MARHIDETYLIHMNGRVYDYQLGRFLSVDPIISSPANSQSINPYSYIGNNPLSGVDPTGYQQVNVTDASLTDEPENFALAGQVNSPAGPLGNGAVGFGGTLQTGNASSTGSPSSIDRSGSIASQPTISGGGIAGAAAAVAGGTVCVGSGACEAAATAVTIGAVAVAVASIVKRIVDFFRSDRLTPEAERAIKSTEKNIQEHEDKIKNFRENPTIRPGTEKMSDEIKQKTIDGRVGKLQKEIEKFKDYIKKVKSGDLKPTEKKPKKNSEPEPGPDPDKPDGAK